VPDRWAAALTRLLDLVPLPDPGFGSLLWQAVVGAWPDEPDETWRERLHAYAEKAMREAGDRTTWTAQDADYEAAVHRAVDAALDDPRVRSVIDEMLDVVTDAGWANGLAAKLVGLTMPGVPDVYQGTELWDQSLVDPDNRRPVDFGSRAELLARLRRGERPGAPGGLGDAGEAKLLLTHVALTTRRDHPEWFTGYSPVAATGVAADHLLAFDRGGAITLATRLPLGLERAGGWQDTAVPLPPGRWVELLTGRRVLPGTDGTVAVGEVLADLPVALLVPDTTGDHGRFDVWAPHAQTLDLVVGDRTVPMERGAEDWWSPTGPEPLGDVDHGYRVDGSDAVVPGPRSRRLPHGVHGPARTVDPAAYTGHDDGWTGCQLAGAVVYELHVGTFTPEGTLDAAIGRLGHLVRLGVDFVELLPVNAFNGTHNWGYDGVLWYAVQETYGGPAAYQRFVDACHQQGLGVIQDVVYNHLGPSGNYLPEFMPIFSEGGPNPWGNSINLSGPDSDEVRRYVIDNALMWLRDMHVDGLRLDAVHALVDERATHVLEELAQEVDRLSVAEGRPLTLIAESDLNDPRMVTPRVRRRRPHAGGGGGLLVAGHPRRRCRGPVRPRQQGSPARRQPAARPPHQGRGRDPPLPRSRR
jgi:glycosidase